MTRSTLSTPNPRSCPRPRLTSLISAPLARAVRTTAASRRQQLHRPLSVPVRRNGSSGTEMIRLAEAGMSTAEYAIGTLAACSLAAVMVVIVRSDAVRTALTDTIMRALGMGG